MKDRSLSWPSLKAAGVRTKNKAQEISGLAKLSYFLGQQEDIFKYVLMDARPMFAIQKLLLHTYKI